jgi:hypothetical protein
MATKVKIILVESVSFGDTEDDEQELARYIDKGYDIVNVSVVEDDDLAYTLVKKSRKITEED